MATKRGVVSGTTKGGASTWGKPTPRQTPVNRPPANWQIPPDRIGLFCPDPLWYWVVLLGPDPPVISGGVGGWEVTERPRQVGMTTWKGNEPYQLAVSVMFDALASGASQERALAGLYRAARGDEDSDPAPWWIAGIPGLPADRWVLQSIEAGDQIRRWPDMERVRQQVGLTFIEHVPPEYVRLRKAALSKAKVKTTMYTVKARDTPQSIARKRGAKWTDLRTLNPGVVKKANQNLRDGSKLRVPVAAAKGKKDKK